MRKLLILPVILLVQSAYAESVELQSAIDAARGACGGISDDMADMKKKAGISTAVGAVGTVSSGVGLGAGIAKANVDTQYNTLLMYLLNEYTRGYEWFEPVSSVPQEDIAEMLEDAAKYDEDKVVADRINELLQKSKRLGNLRTGTMAVATVANVATAAVAGSNTIKGDLESRVYDCIARVDELSRVKMQARIDGSGTSEQIAQADAIYNACSKWGAIDLTPINKRAKGAAISGGVGAGLGLAGTIASAMANSDKVRSGDDKKEKNMNTMANVLAGGTAAAGLTSTIFSASQISAIKRAATVADECEGAL